MRTTLILPDDLYREVKSTAAASGETMTSFVEEALRDALRRRTAAPVPVDFVIVPTGSGGLLPGRGIITTIGQLSWTYFIYGVGFAVLSALFALLFRQAARTMPTDSPEQLQAARDWSRTWTLATATGIVSALVALTPALGPAPWLPGVTYWLIPAGIAVLNVLERRKTRAASAA